MNKLEFEPTFAALTGNSSFPWQQALYDRFVAGDIPASCYLPTGLGKTSVIAVWLIATATHPDKIPRRLVYVVNRRTVVDQTTDEVEKYKAKHVPGIPDFAISTLRGQFADNREWSADPSRSAVICGTVDMIGSRLLFSGYGVGMKGRPLHAGFLGQDVLLVHDEAHLEPAFQHLVKAIECEQKRCKEFQTFRVMELTATSRTTGTEFALTTKDHENETVKGRVWARKTIHLHELRDEKKLGEQIAEEALKFKDSGRAVLVFVRTVDDVIKVRDRLTKEKRFAATLTGTMRGKERDELVEKPIFRRFLPSSPADPKGTAYLVCTSAGEVGVNLSADHLVCDLTTYESMAQRFGRVNRFGKLTDTEIHIIHPTTFKEDDYDQQRKKTLELLGNLKGDGSPYALGELPPEHRTAAFAPPPVILPTSDILFDAWALTTIKEKLPGRPPVEPYLHGLPTEWQPPETQVAWRKEVEVLQPQYVTDTERKEGEPADRKAIAKLGAKLLEDYSLKPHELLREPSYRAFKQFEAMAKRCPGLPVWLLDDDGKVRVLTIADLADKGEKERIEGVTVLLSPSAGGLEHGMLDGAATAPEKDSLDVADEWYADKERQVPRRKRLDVNKPPPGMRLIRRVPLPGGGEETDPEYWYWFELGNQGDTSAEYPVEWHIHVKDVEDRTAAIVDHLPLDDSLRRLVKMAAKYHDHGKQRKLFQTVLGNPYYPHDRYVLAKSGNKGGRVEESYRHEFGSLLDVQKEAEFQSLNDDEKDLVLHLIAAHHGRARPHFPADETFDPDQPSALTDRVAGEIPRRFARLQRKYGRWGLAYLESLLRAGDWAASANPSAFLENQP